MGKKEVKKTVVIKNKLGLHARAAAQFVKMAQNFRSKVEVRRGSKVADGKSIMGILALALGRGSRITICATGEDSEEAVKALVDLVNKKFGEEE